MILLDGGMEENLDVLSVSTELAQMLHGLTETDLTRRLGCMRAGVTDIKHHVWFTHTHWLAIYHKQVFSFATDVSSDVVGDGQQGMPSFLPPCLPSIVVCHLRQTATSLTEV